MPRIHPALLLIAPVLAAVWLVYSSPAWLFQVHPPAQEPSESSVAGPRPFTRKIVAVGDLHGDLPNAWKVLRMADVVDEDGNWSGKIDYFVQTGDIVDRGDNTIELYAWLDELRDQAWAVGGTVLSHLGNHEYMNAIGDWRYVPQSEIETFGGVKKRQAMISSGPIGRTWAANYTVSSRLGLHRSLGPPNTDYPWRAAQLNTPRALSHAALSFVHGGLSPTFSGLSPFPSKINGLGQSFLRKLQTRRPVPEPHPPAAYPGFPRGVTEEEEELYGADGPLWYRGWALDDDKQACAAVDDVLERTGTRRMIMGHTPDFDKIVSRCGGKIIIIDTGICHAYGGVLSALSITYTLTPVDAKMDDMEGKWKEREVVTAIYQDRREVLAADERIIKGNYGVYH